MLAIYEAIALDNYCLLFLVISLASVVRVSGGRLRCLCVLVSIRLTFFINNLIVFALVYAARSKLGLHLTYELTFSLAYISHAASCGASATASANT